ncbi:MAG: SpoIIE family protein phosphatase [Pseudomonadota bacterium]
MKTDRFRVLFDHSSDPHLIFDPDLGITDCNKAAVDLIGAKSADELRSIHPARLSPEYQPCGRRSALLSAEMDAAARESGHHRFEWLHQKIDGTPLPVDVTLNAVNLEDRVVMIVVWHDLTERKRHDRERDELMQRLQDTNRALASANHELQRDLDAAKAAQRSLLPEKDVAKDLAEIAWTFRPCEALGGDHLGVFTPGLGQLAFYVLDVSGHGVQSSLQAAAAYHMLLPRAGDMDSLGSTGRWRNPSEVVNQLNKHFCFEREEVRFITMICGVFDTEKRCLRYVSAGHPAPMVVRGQECRSLNCTPNLPVGIDPSTTFVEMQEQLLPGDRLFVYTDCAFEARAPTGDFFGNDRLSLTLANSTARSIEEHVVCAEDAVLRWCADMPPDDDLTLLGIEVR